MLEFCEGLMYTPELATGSLGSPRQIGALNSVSLRISDKKRVRLTIVNPEPSPDGNVYDTISLAHAERAYINRKRAIRINQDGQPDPENGMFLLFCDAREKVQGNGRVDESRFLRMIACGPKLPIRDLPMCMSNLTGTSLWPVIPNYTEGRPLEDFLVTVARSKASRRSSSGSEGKQ